MTSLEPKINIYGISRLQWPLLLSYTGCPKVRWISESPFIFWIGWWILKPFGMVNAHTGRFVLVYCNNFYVNICTGKHWVSFGPSFEWTEISAYVSFHVCLIIHLSRSLFIHIEHFLALMWSRCPQSCNSVVQLRCWESVISLECSTNMSDFLGVLKLGLKLTQYFSGHMLI